MDELDIAILKKKSLSGIITLTSRTFILQAISFSGMFLLAIVLSETVFGVFAVVSAMISFLGYFSDIGLAAALIQKKEELTTEDLATTFSIQQLLVGTTVGIALAFSGLIASFYHLDTQGLWLLRSLILSFFLSSLKTIPSVILERRLDFKKLVIPQIAENLGFYVVAVILAWNDFGVTSFTWAVLTRGVVGLGAMYLLAPWRIQVGISKKAAKGLIKFGLPFQTNSFIALIKDDLLIIFLGKALPFSEVGYIGWAKKWAEAPLRLIMDSVMRVTFPAFSRIQESRDILGRAIEKTLFGISLFVFPLSVGLLFFIQPFIEIVPRWEKWEPAILSFYLFTVTSAVASLSSPMTNALNAMGKIKITLMLMTLWTISTWVLTVVFLRLFGFNGVALALLMVSSTLWLVVHLMKKFAPFSFWKSIWAPLLGAIIQSGFYGLYFMSLPQGIVWYAGAGLLGAILYAGVLWLLESRRISEIRNSFSKAL